MSTTSMTVDCMHEFRRDSMKSISACRDMWMHSSVNLTAEERERKASWFDARLTKVDAAYSLAAKVIDVVPECQRALRVAARIEAEVGSNEYALEAGASGVEGHCIMKIDAAKFKAGQETALVDARRGVANGPVKGDDPSWAAGYRAALVDFRETFGDDWRARMKQ